MVLLMLPAFLFAMYEKDGMHLEDVLLHVIRVRWLRPPIRKYETENLYETEIFSKERDKFDKSLKLYSLMTTKPEEIEGREVPKD